MMKFIKSKDMILILFFLGITFAADYFFAAGYPKKYIEFRFKNHVIYELDLTRNFEMDAGRRFMDKNFIRVKDGEVYVYYANCSDNECVKTGAIKNVGETIECKPHDILLKIKERE